MLSESPSENNETFLRCRIDTSLPGMGLLLKLLWRTGTSAWRASSLLYIYGDRGRRKTQPRFTNSVRCLPVYIQPQRCFQLTKEKYPTHPWNVRRESMGFDRRNFTIDTQFRRIHMEKLRFLRLFSYHDRSSTILPCLTAIVSFYCVRSIRVSLLFINIRIFWWIRNNIRQTFQ